MPVPSFDAKRVAELILRDPFDLLGNENSLPDPRDRLRSGSQPADDPGDFNAAAVAEEVFQRGIAPRFVGAGSSAYAIMRRGGGE
ncbi:MAG TPA: hypothetical protein VGS01_07770 [Candidatus Limnocylindria bacterium]|nr:hypothetical protein [Candidatus Limnocylindria bacterium]